MRRGYLLMEVLVSIALLAVVVAVSVRLIFTSDRALGAEGERAAAIGGAAELMSDLGRDLRGARGASGDGHALMISGAQSIRYSYSRERGGVVRQEGARADLAREYPGLRARFTVSGELVIAEVSSSAGAIRTAFYLRN